MRTVLEPTQLEHSTFLQFEHFAKATIGHSLKNEKPGLILGFLCEMMRGGKDNMDIDSAFRGITIVLKFESVVMLRVGMVSIGIFRLRVF